MSRKSPPVQPKILSTAASRKIQKKYGMSEDTVIVENPEEASMSGFLWELVKPYIDDATDLDSCRTLIGFAVLAWNVSSLHGVKRRYEIQEMVKSFPLDINAAARREMKGFLHELANRKDILFPHVNRFIGNFDVTERNGSYYLQVISTLDYPPSDLAFPLDSPVHQKS
jgi:hypothetical protein